MVQITSLGVRVTCISSCGSVFFTAVYSLAFALSRGRKLNVSISASAVPVKAINAFLAERVCFIMKSSLV